MYIRSINKNTMKNLITLLIVLISLTGYSQNNPKDTVHITYEYCDEEYISELIIKFINEHRASRGKKPLTVTDELTDYTQSHADKLTKENKYYHSDIGGECDNCMGECINQGETAMYYTHYDEARLVVDQWIQSKGHNRILLMDGKSMGIGVSYSIKYRTLDDYTESELAQIKGYEDLLVGEFIITNYVFVVSR